MGRFIRDVGNNALPIIKRAVGILSDGSVVVMVADHNQVGVTGDGGDNTGIPKLHFYHSTDRLNWTLKATISMGGVGTYIAASMAVDNADNIHVAYGMNSFASVYYSKLTYSAGPTWSVGGGSPIVSSLSGYDRISIVDIDTLNNTEALVVGVFWYSTATGSRKTAYQTYVKPAGGAWVTHPVHPILMNEGHLGHTDDLSVCGENKDTSSSSSSLYTVYTTAKGASGADYGDIVMVSKVNLVTGALDGSRAFAATGMFTGVGGGFRKGWLFNSGLNRFTLAAVVDSSDFKIGLYDFRWNKTLNAMDEQSPVGVSQGRAGISINRGANNHSWASVAYNGDERFFFFGNVFGMAASVTGYVAPTPSGGVYSELGWSRWDNGYGQPSGTWGEDGSFSTPIGVAPVHQIWSGANRNQARSRIDAYMYHYRDDANTPQSFRMESRSLLAPLAPVSVTPEAGSIVSTDRPTLTAGHRLQQYWAQISVKMQWQLASDAGFTTNLRTIDEPATDFILANGTSAPYNALVKSSEIVDAISELTQGTWYIRARTVDIALVYGPWSSAQTFVVTHAPVGSNLYPTGGAVFLYGGGGNVTFTWDFTDPSPYDSQSAYQIIVENANTGATILNSGKVASTVQMATLAIPAPGKDIDLRWKLTLWDSDDVPGPASGYNVFYATDPPAPTILTPTNLSVVTTGVPTVSWTSGIGGTKIQSKYRVMVTQGGTVVYTSNWVDSPDASVALPVGYLSNGEQYTIRLDVQDNLGLQGTTQISFSTDWIEPAGPDDSWEVYVSEYATRGFVYITWTDLNMDADFASWNVYRRLVGSPTWTSLGSYSSGAGRYVHRDYFVGSGRTYEYIVTQMVDRFGDYVESLPAKIIRVTPESDNYWLVDQIQPSNSIPLYQVTSEPFTDEYEQETIHILGAGRITEYGDRLGYSGSLSAQMRDKFVSGVSFENYVLNPSLSYTSSSGVVPDGWATSSGGVVGGVSYGFYDTQNPSPSGKTPFRLYADGMGNTSSDLIALTQNIQGYDFPESMKVPSTTVILTAWIAVSSLNSNKRYKLGIEWLDVGGSVTSSSTSPALSPASDAVESYILASSSDALAGNAHGVWKRLQYSVTVPGTVPAGARIRIQLEGNSGASSSVGELIVGGVQLEIGQRTRYMDGDQFGAEWSGTPHLSYSFGTGYYTARQQRLALERIKAQKTWVYLRNPFGDLWRVGPGNISIQRIPGVGKSEFVDVQMPYEEVKS